MKKFNLLTAVFSIIFIGCSSTYRVSDFTSRDKFYNDFNKFAKNKSVKVTLVNDSSFYVENGAQIKNDTVYSFGQDIITRNKKIPSSDTVEINYTDSNPMSAEILLKDGEKYHANQIEILGDSIYFSYDDKISMIKKISSLDKLKCVSYRNHWFGIPYGFFGGALAGLGIGGGISSYDAHHTNEIGDKDISYPTIVYSGMALGSLGGIIVGWIIGYTYTYQFSP